MPTDSSNTAFECGYCRETVHLGAEKLQCRNCSTTHRYDPSQSSYAVVTWGAQFYHILAALFLASGLVILVSQKTPTVLSVGIALAGFLVHYCHGIRTGVLSSKFFVLRWGWTVYRAKSPIGFLFAAILEGLWVLGLLLGLLLLI